MKKHLILPIVIGFLSFLSVDAFAQFSDIKGTETSVNPWDRSDLGAENIALRDRYSKHFSVSSTENKAMIFTGPIHYKKGNDWKEIKTDLVVNKTGRFVNHPYVNSENEFVSYYPADPSVDGFVVDYKGTILVEKVKGLSFLDNAGNSVGSIPFSYAKYTLEGKNQIRYSEVLSGIDLVYTQNPAGKKMVVELKNAAALNSIPANAFKVVIAEEIEVPADAVHSSVDNQIQIESNGVLVATYETPIANQGPVAQSEEEESIGSISINRAGSTISFGSVFDASWVTSSKRSFPIMLDPTANYGPFSVTYATGRMTSTTGSKSNGYLRLSTSSTTA